MVKITVKLDDAVHKPKVNQILRGEVAIPRRVKTLRILATFL